MLYSSVFWLRGAVQAGAAALSSHVSNLEVLMGNIKSPGSSPFRFVLAEKCYSCSTLSPISLYHNSFVHVSNEDWCESGGRGCRRKAVINKCWGLQHQWVDNGYSQQYPQSQLELFEISKKCFSLKQWKGWCAHPSPLHCLQQHWGFQERSLFPKHFLQGGMCGTKWMTRHMSISNLESWGKEHVMNLYSVLVTLCSDSSHSWLGTLSILKPCI